MTNMAMARALLAVTAFAALAVADTCDTLESTTSISLSRQLSLAYIVSETEYWSTSCGDLKPSCIILPTTTEEVAAVVSVLNDNNETFAIKSGGHNPNNYFASVDGGPLISTASLNEVILDADTETVRVGPGNRWDDVSAALDGTNYTVVGGRIGNVGVGGYMLGGGLSFLSGEYGFAANSVLAFDLVLANASTITVTNSSYPDLFMALKGGGNNFGIVTSYVLQAYPMGQIYGGNLIFDATDANSAALTAAVRDFTEYNTDEKAAVIVTAERTLATAVDLWILFIFYDGESPPDDVFANFTSAGTGPLINTCKTQSYNDLVSGNNWSVLKGSVYTIGTESLPLPYAADGADVMLSIYEQWVNVSNSVALVPGLVASIAFQPVPKQIARVAAAKGGDMLDLDDDVDRIFIELDYSFLLNSQYDTVDQVMRDTYEGIASQVEEYQSAGKMPADVYLPLFQNDCFYPEDYFGRLRPERLALAQSVQADVDPTGFFANRTGGFKIPS
ncbi:FAD binding domain-containing protein [Xylariaceae sp. FL0804]|nr:FAD binding domain-containing protein [Xylariaceae sp. FL0804]